MRKPDFFIVGAPKSGTTAMADYLSRHPDIFMPYRKEMHYFGKDLYKIPHEFFVLDKKQYYAQFNSVKRESRVGEASVMYLFSETAAQEIYQFNPEAQIIIMLRNPVDMLYAYHSQLYWGGYENMANFEDALDAEADRKEGQQIPRCAMMPSALYYRDVASFASQVERYFDVFGHEKVHVIIFDDLKDDVEKVYFGLLDFLNVEKITPESFKIINPNKRARSRLAAEWIQRPPMLFRWGLKLIPDQLRYWFLGKLSRVNTQYISRPLLPKAIRKSLSAYFKKDIERLEILLGRNLANWK